MKHLLSPHLVLIGLMSVPCVVYGQDSPDDRAKGAQPSPTPAKVDAQSSPTPAKADAQPSPTPAEADAQPSPTPAKADAQSSPTPAEADAKPSPTPASAGAHASPAATPKSIGPIEPTVIGLPPVPNHEISVSIGGTDTPTVGSNCCALPSGIPVGSFAGFATTASQAATKTNVDARVAFEVCYAHGFWKNHDLMLVGEFPVVFNPNGDVGSGNLSLARSYSSLFFTPSLRLMYAPDHDKHPAYPTIYPWASLGGGLAHFSPSAISLAGGVSGAKSSTEGALQAGGGVDIGIFRKAITLREEVRYFYSGAPNLGVAGINLRHNLFVSAGIVFRFGKHTWEKHSSEQKTPTASPGHN